MARSDRADTDKHRVHRIMPMRKLFCVCWCLLFLAFVASYFRFASFDYQLTRRIWLQAATADGGGRFIAVCGDPSASWTANTVIERDKNTWRYGLSTVPWGRVSYWESPVDTLGTVVGTYRVDVPLLGPLLIPLALMLVAWAMKRWGAPPRLVWAELWTTAQSSRGALGFFRRVLLVVSIVFAFAAALLWAGSYLDPLPRWRYFGDHFAFVTGVDESDLDSLFGTPPPGHGALAKRLDALIDKRIDEWGRPEKYFSIEITRERVAFRYYTADLPSGSSVSPAWHEFALFEFGQDRVEVPNVVSPLLRRLRSMISPSAATGGLERTVILRLWSLVILFGIWPLWCFFRGPVRRARRRAAGCCPPCGYNLTGLSEPRCPECGTEFDPEAVGSVAKPAC